MEAIDNTDQQADTSVVDSKNARTIKEYKKKYELYEKYCEKHALETIDVRSMVVFFKG